MATFFDLDSVYRDKETWPNPNYFELNPSEISTWHPNPRMVRKIADDPNSRPREFVVTMNIKDLTLPWTQDIAPLPRVYVDFHSKLYNDTHFMNTINGVHKFAKFVCIPDKVQNDENGDPAWIHFKSDMEQIMRFERKYPIVFKVTTRSEDVLPNPDTPPGDEADPTKQTLCTLEMTSYIRDNDYSNHLIEPF